MTKTPFDVRLRNPGNPRLDYQEQNALTLAARRKDNFRRGTTNRADINAFKDIIAEWLYVVIKNTTTDNIEPYSIFTIEDTSVYFTDLGPLANLKQPTDSDKVFLASEEVWITAGHSARRPIILGNQPYLISYDSADGTPVLGEELGPKSGTYKVSTNGSGFVAVSPPDTTNERVWIVRTGKGDEQDPNDPGVVRGLYIVSPKRGDAQDPTVNTLLPGQEVTGILYERSDTSPCPWIPTETEITIRDPEGQNFVFAGEKVSAVKREFYCEEQKVTKYEIVGSHGLRRKGTAYVDIGCNQAGRIDVLFEVGSPDETYSLDNVFNRWGYRRNVWQGDEVFIQYDLITKEWEIEEDSEPIHVRAVLDSQSPVMCPSAAGPFIASSLQLRDKYYLGCDSFYPGNQLFFTNPYKHAAGKGDTLELRRNIDWPWDDPDGLGWEVIDVEKKKKRPLIDLSLQNCGISTLVENIYIENCDEPFEFGPGISGTVISVVTGFTWDNTNCKQIANTSQICAIGGATSGSPIDSLQFTKQTLVEDVFDDLNGLKQFKRSVGVACPDPNTEHTIVEYTECPDPPADNVQGPIGS